MRLLYREKRFVTPGNGFKTCMLLDANETYNYCYSLFFNLNIRRHISVALTK